VDRGRCKEGWEIGYSVTLQAAPQTLSARPPRVGELVLVRSRRWLVDEVIEPKSPRQTCIARLSCADDDAQGQTLEVLWDYELDRLILEEEGWTDLAARVSTNRAISQHFCIHCAGIV
jgi:hypothetical protein